MFTNSEPPANLSKDNPMTMMVHLCISLFSREMLHGTKILFVRVTSRDTTLNLAPDGTSLYAPFRGWEGSTWIAGPLVATHDSQSCQTANPLSCNFTGHVILISLILLTSDRGVPGSETEGQNTPHKLFPLNSHSQNTPRKVTPPPIGSIIASVFCPRTFLHLDRKGLDSHHQSLVHRQPAWPRQSVPGEPSSVTRSIFVRKHTCGQCKEAGNWISEPSFPPPRHGNDADSSSLRYWKSQPCT